MPFQKPSTRTVTINRNTASREATPSAKSSRSRNTRSHFGRQAVRAFFRFLPAGRVNVRSLRQLQHPVLTGTIDKLRKRQLDIVRQVPPVVPDAGIATICRAGDECVFEATETRREGCGLLFPAQAPQDEFVEIFPTLDGSRRGGQIDRVLIALAETFGTWNLRQECSERFTRRDLPGLKLLELRNFPEQIADPNFQGGGDSTKRVVPRFHLIGLVPRELARVHVAEASQLLLLQAFRLAQSADPFADSQWVHRRSTNIS